MERQFQVIKYLRDHPGADHFVAMKGPAGAFFKFLGGGFTDVMQQSGPAEPQIIRMLRYIVHYLESMVEVILMPFIIYIFRTGQSCQLRQDELQQAGPEQQIKADGRLGTHQYLIQLHGHPFAANDPDPVRFRLNAIKAFFLHVEIQLRGKPDGTHHPQRIIAEGLLRLERCADDLKLYVLYPVKRVYQLQETGFAEA